jgi:hypothetical protein
MNRLTASAGLLHRIGWDFPADSLELSKYVKLGPTGNSRIWQLYESLCANQNTDDGEPHCYESYVLIEPDGITNHINFRDPDDLLDRVCNVVALVLGHPDSNVQSPLVTRRF